MPCRGQEPIDGMKEIMNPADFETMTCSPDHPPLLIKRESMTLREKACDALRQAISDHRFPPGTRLIERDLCEQLGVSRTSVREALRHLESEHLIEMVPHKGPVVAKLTPEEISEIYDVRCLLEGHACEKFAEAASESHILALEEAFERLKRAVRQRDNAKSLQIKLEFYQIIFDGSQSSVCRNLVKSLVSRIGALRQLSLTLPGRDKVMIEEIGRLVTAARQRNAAAMKAASIAHVKSALEAVLIQLAEDDNNETGATRAQQQGNRKGD